MWTCQTRWGRGGGGFDDDESCTKLPDGFALPSSQRRGTTALMFGAQEGHAPVVEMLLAAGANKDLQQNVERPQPSPLPTHDLGG